MIDINIDVYNITRKKFRYLLQITDDVSVNTKHENNTFARARVCQTQCE